MLKPPTPAARFAIGSLEAESMSAPLTWSGVHVGFFALSVAAAAATNGAEKDVPLSCM